MPSEAPQNPVGPFVAAEEFSSASRTKLIADLSELPAKLEKAVAGLSEIQLETKYRNWSIRQIVHHIADSHINSYVRFKWALTEDAPVIKAYDEGHWSELNESKTGAVTPSLQLLAGLHARWVQLLEKMSDSDFDRTFFHPESGESVSLNSALVYYAWHGKHHVGQILWLRETHAF